MNKNQNWRRILTLICVMAMLVGILVVGSVVAFAAEDDSVAQVGSTKYATIDEAIANWTNGTTLTLLADVTLSDVVTLKSTEHHILDLGTYTLTAASNKDAFVIKACGTGDAERTAITIKADANNPGGVNAGKKCVVYYKYADGGISGNDRPIIKIEGGVFTGNTSSLGTAGIYTIGTASRKCATLNISGGTFNCSINGSGKSKLLISGGTFNYSVGSQGDSTALRLISGGKFKTLGFMTADSNNTKFWFGTSMANSNVGVYVDDNGYLVVGGGVVTEAGETFEASSANYGGWSSYLQYSSAATNDLYYTSVEEALADNNKATGSVTVYVDELDLAGINYKGTIVVPEGKTLKITNAPEGLKTEGNVTVVVEVDTLDELQAALAADGNSTIVITAQIVIPEGEEVILNLNGKTVNSVFNGTSTTNHIYALSNKGTLTITDTSKERNGSIGSINSRGIYNYGVLILEAGAINSIDGNGGYAVNNESGSTFVMNGGVVAATYEDDYQSSSGGYDATALKIPAGCTATLNGGVINNVCDFTFAVDTRGTLNIPADSTIEINGTHGAIYVAGGNTTINGGKFTIPADEYSRTDNVLYVSGGELVINGGTFIGDSDTASGGTCLYDAKGTATINGGSFSGSSGGDVWGTTGTTIKGGTFENLTETQHIADGYEFVDGTVALKAPKQVYTYEELIAALAEDGAYVLMMNDITATATQATGYGKAGIVVGAGDVLDGGNHKLTINGANATWDCAIAMTGGEVKNLTVAGAMRGIFMPGADGDVVVDNCVFEDVIYTFNSDAGSTNHTVTIKNTTLNGWTSFSAVHKSVTFESCTFGEGSGYAFCRPYQATTFVGCEFEEGYEFDTSKAAANSFAFDNCTYDGAMFYNGGDVVVNGENKHYHKFVAGETVAPSFDNEGYTPYTCACGETENRDFVPALVAAAQIDNTKYETLQAAINAVQNGETITLLDDVTENVTLTEAVGLYYIIDGNGNKLNGTITINPLSDTNDNRRITIQNVNFVNIADEGCDFIYAVKDNHYPRLSVLGCTFTGNGKDKDVAIRTKSAYDLIIKNCEGTGLHSFLQNTAGVKVTVQNVTVTESKGGLALGTAQNVTIRNCQINTRTYGIRLDAVLNTSVTLNGNTVESYIPVSIRKASATEYKLSFNGSASSYTATNTDGVWCAIVNTEYEDGVALNAPTGNVKITWNTDVLDESAVYGAYEWPVHVVFSDGYTKGFDSLKSAMSFGYSGGTLEKIIVHRDITESMDSLEGNIVTDNPNGVTIKNTIYDEWIYCSENFTIGEGVTYDATGYKSGLFVYCDTGVIYGTVIVDCYYQRYANSKLTIYEPGSMTVKTETFILRYTDGDPNAGIYVIGDNNDDTVGLKLAVAYFYQGMINAKDANIEVGTYWQTNETDGQGTANLVLDNSKMTVTVSDHNMKATGNSTVTLKNGSSVVAARGYEGVAVNADATSSFVAGGKSIFVAVVDGVKYTTLADAIAAVEEGGTVTLLADVIFTEETRTHNSGSWYDGLYYQGDKSFTIDLGGFTITHDGSVNDYLLNFKNVGNKANTITLKNGTVDAGTAAFCAICTSATQENQLTINLEDINVINNISNGSTIKVRGGVILNVNAGTKITGTNSYLGIECIASTVNIYDGAEIYMNGTSSYNGCLVGVGGAGVVNVYGGYGKGVKGGFIAMTSGGTINIYGGEWIANTNGAVGSDSNWYVLTAQSNSYESGFAGASIINVYGGTLRGGIDAWVLNNVEGEQAGLNISGGNFNVNPARYLATGYVATENNGVYTVAKAVAKIGTTYYTSLEAAFKAATSGCTIEILQNVTIDGKWDCRDYATNGSHSQFKESVTINGNGHTIKFTGTVSDGNWNTIFRFEENAVVNNLTIDISEATGCQRVITAKKSLTVDGLTIIGAAKYGIIFGEGATDADRAAAEIVIKNSTLTGTRRAISDNEGGKDVKSVVVTDNTLNANVCVSAFETITFTGNTVSGGYVDLRAYTENNTLNVTATGNTLVANTEAKYNNIKANGTINAQNDFVVPAKGDASVGYVSTTTIWGECGGNAKKSFVIKIYSGETYLGSTTLNNIDGILNGNVWVTWHAMLIPGNETDPYWTTEWAVELTSDKAPTHIELWIDGVCVDNGTVYMSGPDNLNPVKWEELGGVKYICTGLKGAGTAENPYLINRVEDLIFFRDSVNAGNNYAGKYVVLAADIDLAGINWTPIGNVDYNSQYAPADTTKVFSGTFDGNGKVIYNLTMTKILNGGADAEANLGLFGITGAGATIKNVTLTNVTITTDGRNVGALAAFAYMATLDNITVNGNIKIEGGNNVAGVCAMTRHHAMSATNITVKGNEGSYIKGNNIVGGIFAEIAPNGTVQTFKNLSVENVAISGKGGVGGIVGLLTDGTVENVTVKNVEITANTLYNGDAMGRIRMGSVAGLLGSTKSTIKNATVENVTAKNLDGNAVKLPVIGANYAGSVGNATEAKIGDTYYATLKHAVNAANGNAVTLLVKEIYISDLAGLKAFRDAVNAGTSFAGVTVYLAADIDLGNEAWAPIGSDKNHAFKGVFDGQNHTISNLSINNANLDCAGLFGYTNGATIKNVNVKNVDITAYSHVAAIVGHAYTGNIENCHVSGTINLVAKYAYAAGITADGYVNVRNCSVIADDLGTIKVIEKTGAGGITGWRGEGNLVIENCTVKNLKITAWASVGGITGIAQYNNVIDGCTVENVTLTKTRENGQASIGLVSGNWNNKSDDNYTITITNNHFDNVSINGTAITSLYNLYGSNYSYYDKVIKLVESGNTYGTITTDFKIVVKTLAELKNALAYAKEGDVINLGADIEASEVLLIGKSLTINGNGHKVTSSATRVFRVTASNVEVTLNDVNMVSRTVMTYPNDIRGISIDPSLTNIKLTLNNCSVDFTDASACDWAYAVNVSGNGTGHTLTINGGSYEGANAINVHGANNTVVVKDATLTSLYPNNDVYYGACIWVLQNQGSSVEATGNTFNGANAIAFNLGTGTALTESNNTDNTTRVVAKIGNVYYTTLQDAINAGGEVVLLRNVALTESITVPAGASVTLNLNGKTITGTDNATGSFGLINNKGTLTITGNGKITLTATNDRDWNAYSSVISNQPGGKLVVENGTIEHLGGTDMAYAIDNLTNGKGTYAETVINGGIIKSTYRAIRQFLNGVEAQNILTVNGGTIEGTNKAIWMQDPSKNANTGKLTVGENAVINGDVYLSVTAGSTEWPVEVSIANSAVNGDVLTGNVPSGYVVENVNGSYTINKYLIMVTYPVGNPVYPEGKVEYYNDMLQAVPYTTNCPRLEGATITLLGDVSAAGMRFMENDMIFDLNGFTFTITAGTGSQGTNTSGFQIRPEVTTNVIFKNGTIKVAEGAPVVWMFNCYATDFIVENVTVDCTNMAWSYGNSCYVVVSRSGDNVQFLGTTKVVNFNSEVAGLAYSVGGTMTVADTVVLGGDIELGVGATLTAPAGLNVYTDDGYGVVYNNGIYSVIKYVAELNGVKYDSFDAAYKAAKTGDTIKLLDTVVITKTKAWINYSTKKITIDATNVDVAFRVEDGAYVSFGSMTVNTNGTAIVVDENANVDFYGGTYNATTVIEVESGRVNVMAGSYTGAIEAEKSGVSVQGGKFTVDPTEYLVAGYAVSKNSDDTFGVVDAVAKIGNTYYATLQAAITAAAQNGDTITLLADVNECVTISGKTLTLDLNGKKIYGANSDAVAVNEGSNVTIKNGTLESHGKNCGGVWVKNATAIIENCTVIGQHSEASVAVYASNGATVTINNCELTADHYAVIMMGANVTINGGTLTAPMSVSANGSDDYDDATLTINGGTFNGSIYWPAKGKLTINDGIFTANTALYVKSGSLEINGGTFTGKGEAKDYEYKDSGFNSTGSAIVIENVGVSEYDAVASVSITGGTFTSVNNVAIMSVTAGHAGVAAKTGFISGGTFSSAVAEEFCAAGYIPVENADGTFGVKAGKFVAELNGVKYETLEAAYAAYNANGGELVLLTAVKSAYLKLGATIGIYFDVDMAAIYNGLDYVAVITGGGKTYVIDMEKWLTIKDKTYTVLFEGLTAKQMSVEFTVQIMLAEQVENKELTNTITSKAVATSVKSYVERGLAANIFNDADKALLTALLNYGAQAEKYFGQTANGTANDVEGLDTTNEPTPSVLGDGNKPADTAGLYYLSSLNAQNNLQFNFKFFAEGLENATKAVITDAEGNEIAVFTFNEFYTSTAKVNNEVKDLYVIVVDNIDASYYNVDMTCTIYGADGVITSVTDSILEYCTRAYNGNKANNNSNAYFFASIIEYGKAVAAYKAAGN